MRARSSVQPSSESNSSKTELLPPAGLNETGEGVHNLEHDVALATPEPLDEDRDAFLFYDVQSDCGVSVPHESRDARGNLLLHVEGGRCKHFRELLHHTAVDEQMLILVPLSQQREDACDAQPDGVSVRLVRPPQQLHDDRNGNSRHRLIALQNSCNQHEQAYDDIDICFRKSAEK